VMPAPAFQRLALLAAQLQKRNRSSQGHGYLPCALDAGKAIVLTCIYDSGR
jgi:hypothetical protein